jgi:hypothetical protein
MDLGVEIHPQNIIDIAALLRPQSKPFRA